MPIYGYRCQSCNAEFEVTQRMSDPPGAACPACGGAGTRLFYPAGIVFKGSGFYKTDSRSASTAASSPDPAASKPAPAKSEPTPAAPASTPPATAAPAKAAPSTTGTAPASSTD